MDAVEKYHAKEKAAEFAQKKAADRGNQTSEDQKNKSLVNKAGNPQKTSCLSKGVATTNTNNGSLKLHLVRQLGR
jgi:hypothetical protein